MIFKINLNKVKKLGLNMLLILLISLLVSILAYCTQDQWSREDVFVANAPIPDPIHFQTIALSEALPLYYEPGTIVLDVREEQYYKYGHITNALNLPLADIKNISPAFLAELKASPEIILYCNGVSCGASYFATRQLMDKGVHN
jgi:rhodanese-related sulfurtransferase